MPLLDPKEKPSDFHTHNPHEEAPGVKRGFEYVWHAAMVAQLVKDKETLKSKEVQDAITKEWKTLRKENVGTSIRRNLGAK